VNRHAGAGAAPAARKRAHLKIALPPPSGWAPRATSPSPRARPPREPPPRGHVRRPPALSAEGRIGVVAAVKSGEQLQAFEGAFASLSERGTAQRRLGRQRSALHPKPVRLEVDGALRSRSHLSSRSSKLHRVRPERCRFAVAHRAS